MHKDVERMDKMRVQRGWSVYKLAQVSGLSESTINKWLSTDTAPTVDALRKICKAFEISLSDFFAEGNTVEITPVNKALYNDWQLLTKEEKEAVKAFMKTFISKK